MPVENPNEKQVEGLEARLVAGTATQADLRFLAESNELLARELEERDRRIGELEEALLGASAWVNGMALERGTRLQKEIEPG